MNSAETKKKRLASASVKNKTSSCRGNGPECSNQESETKKDSFEHRESNKWERTKTDRHRDTEKRRANELIELSGYGDPRRNKKGTDELVEFSSRSGCRCNQLQLASASC